MRGCKLRQRLTKKTALKEDLQELASAFKKAGVSAADVGGGGVKSTTSVNEEMDKGIKGKRGV